MLNVIFTLTISILIVASIPVINQEFNNQLFFVIGINLLSLLLLLSIALKTEYKIKNNLLYWQSGPFYGKIKINTIHKIQHHKGIYVPTLWKPALSQIGLIITYNKYDDIYISPENEAEFIAKLLELNPTIEIC